MPKEGLPEGEAPNEIIERRMRRNNWLVKPGRNFREDVKPRVNGRVRMFEEEVQGTAPKIGRAFGEAMIELLCPRGKN
jgi:hypothetical protein